MAEIQSSQAMKIRVLTKSEVSQEFLQGMANRMDVSFHKYGPVMKAKGRVDEIACLEKRLQLYKETGNTEWLMDVANFAMIEFMHKGSEKFRATDSDESPGLTYKDGAISSEPHTMTDTQVSQAASDFYARKGGR